MGIRNRFIVTALGVLALSSKSHAGPSLCDTSTNLVVNCGFETGDFTGWSLSGHDVPGQQDNLYGVEGQDPVDGINPNSGGYQAFFADLASNATTLSQTLATVTGGIYNISIRVAQDATPDGYYGNTLSFAFGGTTYGSYNQVPVQGYTDYDFLAVANSSSSLLSLAFGDGLGEFLVDDVSVTAISLPPPPPPPPPVPGSCDAITNNLVVNCGFETGDFTGWNLSGNDVPAQQGFLYGVDGQDSFDGISPNSGNYQAFFGDYISSPTTLSQVLPTETGTTYNISFVLAQDAAPDANDPNALSVAFGGATIASYTQIPLEGYTLYEFTATADSSDSLFSLTAANDPGYFDLDDLVVTAIPSSATVPEPTTLALTVSAAFGLGLTRRRRRRNQKRVTGPAGC